MMAKGRQWLPWAIGVALAILVGCQSPTTPTPTATPLSIPSPPAAPTLIATLTACVTPPSGMVAWWPLDDAVGQSTVQDLAGGNNGTTKDLNGNPLNITLGLGGGGPGVVSQLPASGILYGQLQPVVVDPNTSRGALFFNQSFVEVPHHPDLNIGPNGFTLILWVFTAGAIESIQPLVEKWGPNDGYSLYLDSWDSAAKTYTLRFWLNGTLITGPQLQLSSPLSPSDWHGIAARVSPTGSVTLTVCDLNGNCTSSSPTTVANFTTSNSGPLRLGRSTAIIATGAIAAELALDEVEVFNRELTPAEFPAIYDAERQGKRKCQPTPTSTPIACALAPNGIVAWWPLDETAGPTAFDIVDGHHGTFQNNPSPAGGNVDGAWNFTNGFVEVPNHPDFDFSTGEMTIDAWIQFQAPAGYDPNDPDEIVWKRTGGPQNTEFSFQLSEAANSLGQLQFAASINGNLVVAVMGGPNLRDGAWHHVAVTLKSGGSAILYVDGVQVASAPATAFANLANPEPLRIGMPSAAWYPQISFRGLIDEVEIFNRALAPAEIQAIYNAGSAGKCK
ncbi:LamG-like jellyroll fold domain-containing protein [Thermoflexus sp.]|uniref:LamG domain-containing protein n=1 Tax=Thermoflexus sp. TaxID=1969742 RepID=UPI0035E44772